jgi:hypothetical protein
MSRIKKSHRREPRDDGFRENELGSVSVSSISAITSDSEDQRVLLAVVLLSATSTRLGALSLPNAFTGIVAVIATLCAMARVAALWGCVPMIVTLRKDVASAMPAHAADALVDLMSVLQTIESCVLSATIFVASQPFGCAGYVAVIDKVCGRRS